MSRKENASPSTFHYVQSITHLRCLRRGVVLGVLFCFVLVAAGIASGGAGSKSGCEAVPRLEDVRGIIDSGSAVALDKNRIVEVGSLAVPGASYNFSVLFTYSACGFSSLPAVPLTIDFSTLIGAKSYDWANAVAVDGAGRLVLAGYAAAASVDSELSVGSPQVFAIARIDPGDYAYPSGNQPSLDSSFGSSGQVLTRFGAANNFAIATAVAIDSVGRIVVAGYSDAASGANPVSHFAVARYNPDGSLDDTFGTGGRVLTDFADIGGGSHTSDQAHGVAVDDAGRIVVAGYSWDTDGTFGTQFALARYKADGTLDTTFGRAGKVLTSLADGARSVLSADYAEAVRIDLQGRIVVAGFSNASNPSVCNLQSLCQSNDFALVRYLPNGILDGSFGTGGKVLTDFAGNRDEAYAMAIDSAGQIVVVGSSFIPSIYCSSCVQSSLALARYDTTGGLDHRFGNGGTVTTNVGTDSFTTQSTDRGRAVVIDWLDRIVVAGSTVCPGCEGGGNERFVFVIYDTANADVSLSATPSRTTLHPGETVTITHVVTNAGPDNTLAHFAAAIGVNLTLRSIDASRGTCVEPLFPGHVECQLGLLAAPDQVTITVTAEASGTSQWLGTPINSLAEISANDQNIFNDFVETPITVNDDPKTADLDLFMVGVLVPDHGGDIVVYDMTVTNKGPLKATGVTLHDALVDTYDSARTTDGSCNLYKTNGRNATTSLDCVIGDLDPGGFAIVTLEVKAPHKGHIASTSNSASVSANEPDPIIANNTATETVTIR